MKCRKLGIPSGSTRLVKVKLFFRDIKHHNLELPISKPLHNMMDNPILYGKSIIRIKRVNSPFNPYKHSVFFVGIGKQCRPRSDAELCGV